MPEKVPAVVLSGGLSSRLGQPKALVTVNNKSLLSIAVEKLQNAACHPIIVVTNRDLQFDALMQSKGASIVVNNYPENGRTGSLKIGLKSVIAELGKIPKKLIMCPIDRPGWKASHIGSLIASSTSTCLSDNGSKGHPVSLVKNDLLTVLNAADNDSLRTLVNFDNVEVTNALLELNIDTPEDLEKLRQYADFFDEL